MSWTVEQSQKYAQWHRSAHARYLAKLLETDINQSESWLSDTLDDDTAAEAAAQIPLTLREQAQRAPYIGDLYTFAPCRRCGSVTGCMCLRSEVE